MNQTVGLNSDSAKAVLVSFVDLLTPMRAVFLAMPVAVLRKILGISVELVVTVYLIRQFRKPSRWVGRPFLWIMNQRHSNLTDWGLQHVQIEKNFTILDVGCGGGRTIQKLAALAPVGKVYGADYANGSVAASRAKNATLVREHKVEVVQASVSNLPFPENTFDLVSAVETQYFWPDLLNDMKEVCRVLKPGGMLVVIAEAYKGGGKSKTHDAVISLLGSGCLSVTEHRDLFAKAGYSDVQLFEDRKRGWICVTGRKS